MDYGEYSKRRLKNEERMGVMMLDMLTRSYGDAVNALGDRLKDVKYVKRDSALLSSICKRLIKAVFETAPGTPADLAAQIIRQSRDFHLVIERKAVVRRQDECVMPIADEWQFVQITLDARCSICLKDDRQCRECGVRKLLRRYLDEPDPGCLSGCGYSGVKLSDSKQLNKQERL